MSHTQNPQLRTISKQRSKHKSNCSALKKTFANHLKHFLLRVHSLFLLLFFILVYYHQQSKFAFHHSFIQYFRIFFTLSLFFLCVSPNCGSSVASRASDKKHTYIMMHIQNKKRQTKKKWHESWCCLLFYFHTLQIHIMHSSSLLVNDPNEFWCEQFFCAVIRRIIVCCCCCFLLFFLFDMKICLLSSYTNALLLIVVCSTASSSSSSAKLETLVSMYVTK